MTVRVAVVERAALDGSGSEHFKEVRRDHATVDPAPRSLLVQLAPGRLAALVHLDPAPPVRRAGQMRRPRNTLRPGLRLQAAASARLSVSVASTARRSRARTSAVVPQNIILITQRARVLLEDLPEPDLQLLI